MDEEGKSAEGKWKKEGGRERKSEKGRVGLHFSPIKYHAPDRIELVITQSGRWSLVTWRLQASALPNALIFLLLCTRDFSTRKRNQISEIVVVRYFEYIIFG